MGKCLKGTIFACPCDSCMAELIEKGKVHTAWLDRLKNNIAAFWTDDYSAKDKDAAMIILHAGFERHENEDEEGMRWDY